MARNIIDLICNSCSCGKEEAQEYLDDEIRNLQELQADNDLRGEDFEIACSNLGLDHRIRKAVRGLERQALRFHSPDRLRTRLSGCHRKGIHRIRVQ